MEYVFVYLWFSWAHVTAEEFCEHINADVPVLAVPLTQLVFGRADAGVFVLQRNDYYIIICYNQIQHSIAVTPFHTETRLGLKSLAAWNILPYSTF